MKICNQSPLKFKIFDTVTKMRVRYRTKDRALSKR